MTSLAERLAAHRGRLIDLVDQLSDQECRDLLYDWRLWARPSQLAPDGDWFCWLVLAGRGFGKTRLGAEWVRQQTEGSTPLQGRDVARIALIGETLGDVRAVMIEGESGLLACARPDARPLFEPSKRRLTWPNGVIAEIYGAVDPDQLRGPQHHVAWADEVAKWPKAEEAWSNLVMGLRLGSTPRLVATTTPRPLKWLKQLANHQSTVLTRGATIDNKANLPAVFLDEIERRYAGTRLGRQELSGELLEDMDGALWTRSLIEQARKPASAPFSRIVVAVDPPVVAGSSADACGIVIAGLCRQGQVYVLEDATVQGLSPAGWMARALDRYAHYGADRLVAEVNNGGDLVRELAYQQCPGLSYRAVRASRGKIARAEPVAALYERGLVHHTRPFPELEDEMCQFTGATNDDSPDRLDALVWAVTDLMPALAAEPKLRSLA